MGLIKFIILLIYLLIGMWTDYKYGKIYNWMSFSMMGIGIIFGITEGKVLKVILSILFAFIVLFPFFLKGMGAGDVKFAMGISAFVGIKSFLLILGVAGILVIITTLGRGLLKQAFKNIVLGIRKTLKKLYSSLKLSILAGTKIEVDSGTKERKASDGYRIRYGVYLGLSGIIVSVYQFLQQGGVK